MLSPVLSLTPQNTITSPLFSKYLHWLKIPEQIEYKAISNTQSLTYNTHQSSQPSYLRQLFTIQPSRSTRSSSALTVIRPYVTSSLKFADRSIAIAIAPFWNKLPLTLRKLSDPSYGLTKSSFLALSTDL